MSNLGDLDFQEDVRRFHLLAATVTEFMRDADEKDSINSLIKNGNDCAARMTGVRMKTNIIDASKKFGDGGSYAGDVKYCHECRFSRSKSLYCAETNMAKAYERGDISGLSRCGSHGQLWKPKLGKIQKVIRYFWIS